MADESTEKVKKPGVVILAAVINFVFAILWLVASVALIGLMLVGNAMGLYEVLADRLSQAIARPNFSFGLVPLFLPIAALCICIGVFFLMVGIGLLRGNRSAWYLQVTLCILGLVGFLSSSIFSLLVPALPVSAVINTVVLVLFLRPLVRDHFKV